MIEDGIYDVIVVDADRDSSTGALHVELVVCGGPRKGELVALRSRDVEGDAVGLLGLPGTLTVADGVPRLVIERA